MVKSDDLHFKEARALKEEEAMGSKEDTYLPSDPLGVTAKIQHLVDRILGQTVFWGMVRTRWRGNVPKGGDDRAGSGKRGHAS